MKRVRYAKRLYAVRRPASAPAAPALHPVKRLHARFYKTANGNEPVRDWIRALEARDRKIVGGDIATVELGWPIGMPVCRPVSNGLREVRSTIMEGKVEARVYFDVVGDLMLLLNAQTGKSRQADAIRLAAQRLSDHATRAAQAKKEDD